MQWADEGIVLGMRKHGESSTILELMTRLHGRHLGLVHGGRSKRLQPVLQPGNSVDATWRARIDEQLGTYSVEEKAFRSGRFINTPLALYGVGAVASLLRLVPERDPHPGLFDASLVLLDHLHEPVIAPALFVRFELALLAELGFGLDLASCAATGQATDLVFVSPKSGRAVSAEAGRPYKDKLLSLPSFLCGTDVTGNPPTNADIKAGFQLTDFFLRSRIFEPRGLLVPDERARFAALATRDDM
jgi:DNA repair protein RecO (recombination protein O)